jgi:hypothetical protein
MATTITKRRLYGITSIKMGSCGAAGAMGSSLTAIDKLKRDSVTFTKDIQETQDLMVEESEYPDFQLFLTGKPFVFEFETYSITPANLIKAFGGTNTTTTKWKAPVTESLLEQSVEICTKSVEGHYMKIEIVRAAVKAQLTAPLKRGDAGSIKFTVTTLTPENTSGTYLSPLYMTIV